MFGGPLTHPTHASISKAALVQLVTESARASEADIIETEAVRDIKVIKVIRLAFILFISLTGLC